MYTRKHSPPQVHTHAVSPTYVSVYCDNLRSLIENVALIHVFLTTSCVEWQRRCETSIIGKTSRHQAKWTACVGEEV